MPIRYSLQRDALNDSGAYHAHVNPGLTLSLDDLVDRMAGASNAVERPRLFATANLLMDAVTQALSQGDQVNLPICRLRPAIRGTFSGPDESYDPARHTVTVVVATGTELKKRLAQVSVEQESEGRGTDRPQPKTLRRVPPDGDDGDSIVQAGDVMEILGKRLKFNPAGEDEGLFLQPLTEDAAPLPEAAIPVPRVIKRTDQRLMFQVPAAPPGRYQCVVRRRFGRHASILREGLVPGVLEVTDANGGEPPPATASLAGRVRFSERLVRAAEAASGDAALPAS